MDCAEPGGDLPKIGKRGTHANQLNSPFFSHFIEIFYFCKERLELVAASILPNQVQFVNNNGF